MSDKPALFIFTGAYEHTGALIAAYREAVLLEPYAEVTLVLSSRSELKPAHFPGVAGIVYLPLAQPSRRLGTLLLHPFALFRSGWWLRQALRKAGCEHLQVNDVYFLEGAVARLLGYRGQIVTWVRIDPGALGSLFGGLCVRVARSVSSHVIAVSQHIQGRLPAGYPARILYEPAPETAANASVPTTQRFVFIGNYIEGKGQDIAIQAFSRLAADFPDAELHFYGGDMSLARNRDYLDRLKRLAANGPAGARIHFHGFAEDTGPALDGALAALSLSRAESFSLTCQEASARGVAVIATDCGGPAEIIDDGRTGFLVPVDDVAAVAERMRRLFSDPVGARAMGASGAKLVRERFRADRFVAALVDIFDLPRQAGSDPKPQGNTVD